MFYIILPLILLAVLLWALTTAITAKSFAPWVPCWKKDLKRIFALADLKTGETFYDLGCGTGKTVIYAAQNFQAKAIGVEISFILFLICKIKQFLAKNKNLKFKLKNLFKENLSQADVIYFFGMPKNINSRLKEKLKKECKKGTRIISYVFSIEGLTLIKKDKPYKKDLAIYLYKI
ncbi:MAG: methyltransferase domain-containing protein [bacterium]